MFRAVAVRRGLQVATVGSIAVALALAGAALAAKPKRGARFSGHTSAPAVSGFLAPVAFTVAQDGRSLKGFSFGSFGCFGAGGFRPGVNPYKGNSIIRVGTVKVASTGRFSVSKARSRVTVAGQTTTTTISVTGRFTKPKAATGTITFTQKVTGSFESSCGPASIGFGATAR